MKILLTKSSKLKMSGPGYFFPPPAQPDSAWQNPVGMNPSWHPQPFLMPQQAARFAPPPMNSLDNYRPFVRAPAFERSFQGQGPRHNHGLNHEMRRMPFMNKSRGRGSGSSPRGRRAPGSSIRNQLPRPPTTELSPEIKQEVLSEYTIPSLLNEGAGRKLSWRPMVTAKVDAVKKIPYW